MGQSYPPFELLGPKIYFRLVMEPHEIPNNTQYIE